MMRAVFLIVLLLLTGAASYGQSMHLFLDQPFYAGGESMRIACHFEDDDINGVLIAELKAPSDASVNVQYVRIHQGVGTASFAVPRDTETGFYRLAFLDPSGSILSSRLIPVFDLEESGMPVEGVAKPELDMFPFLLNKDVFEIRDTIILNSTNPIDISGTVSVIPSDWPLTSPSKQEVQLLSYVPVAGRLLDHEGNPLLSNLIIAYNPASKQFFRGESNEDELHMYFPDSVETGLLQFFNLNIYQDWQPVFESIPISSETYSNASKPAYTLAAAQHLTNWKKIQAIHRLFPDTNPPDQAPVRIAADRVYHPSEYKGLTSLTEFIDEAIINARVRGKTPTLRLFNSEEGERFPDHPWYIVDGMLTFNESFVFDISLKDVETISLYTNSTTIWNHFEPFMLRNGIMEITTRDVKYARQIRNQQNVAMIPGIRTPTMETLHKDRPSVRSVLYWHTFRKPGTRELRIPLPDNTGQFLIFVQGTDSSETVTYSTYPITIRAVK